MHGLEDGLGVTAMGGELLAGPRPATPACAARAYGQFAAARASARAATSTGLAELELEHAGRRARIQPGPSHGSQCGGAGLRAGGRPVNVFAPGGTFPRPETGCTSCHDPHGNTNFRLLYGQAKAHHGPGPLRFTAPAPTAVATDRSPSRPFGGGDESNARHTIFIAGLSEWCGNAWHAPRRRADGFSHRG